MRALISLILSSMLLNLSVHAGSSSKNSTHERYQPWEKHPEQGQPWERGLYEKQKMEDSTEAPTKTKKYYRGFEYNPRPYSPSSTPEERIQTED